MSGISVALTNDIFHSESMEETASDLAETGKTSQLKSPCPTEVPTVNDYGLTSYAELLSIDQEDTSGWSYQPGDIVMEEMPYASVVSLNCSSSLCHSCYQLERAEIKLKRCARCRFARYCDDSCAKKAWPVHKMECSLLAKYFSETKFFPDALIRLVNLVMIKVWKGQMTMPSDSCQPPTERQFDSLCSHTSEIDEELANSQKFKLNMREIRTYMGAEVCMEIGEDIVAEVYSRVVTNTICIADREGNQLGLGLFLGVSQFDHNCVPNALFFAQKKAPQVQIVAVAPIKALKDVRICYVDPMKPTEERRAELKESYYFSCGCGRCHSIQRDAMARSLACPNKHCDGFILLGKDWLPLGPCAKCDFTVDNSSPSLKDGKDLMLTINDFIDANAPALLFPPDSPAPSEEFLELLLGLEQVATLVLFKMNYYRFRLSTSLVQFYSSVFSKNTKNTKNAKKCFLLQMDVLETYRFTLGDVSMPAFLALRDAAKWCLELEDWEKLKVLVRKAQKMGRILYQVDDPFLKELSDMLPERRPL